MQICFLVRVQINFRVVYFCQQNLFLHARGCHNFLNSKFRLRISPFITLLFIISDADESQGTLLNYFKSYDTQKGRIENQQKLLKCRTFCYIHNCLFYVYFECKSKITVLFIISLCILYFNNLMSGMLEIKAIIMYFFTDFTTVHRYCI